MAASIVTFFMQKLSALMIQEANLVAGVDEQINSLRNELEWIHSVLKDADGGKFIDNERARLWVNQVRSISYEGEDVIDEFIFKVERQQRRGRAVPGIRSLCICYCSIIQLKLRHDLGNQIEKIKKRIEEVSANKSKYGIETLQFGETSSSSSQQSLSRRQIRKAPLVEEVDVVGFEDEREMLVRQLIHGESRLSILSIVGMGGLGKTTLAKKVYNSNDVCRHFELRAWITISQEYKIRDLLEGLLSQVVEFNEEQQRRVAQMSDQQLQRELYGYLKEVTYLVVVDDIWHTEDWDILKATFPNATTRSRVMFTTRNREVALHADMENTPHQLRFLSDEECWTLFCKKALSKNVPIVLFPELHKVGRNIVAKCGGLPLAIVVLGGLLSKKDRILSEWAKVLKRISGEGHDQITQILALSYDDLPYYLKPCFLYLGVFPEDYEIRARKLIQLWLAEGLVQPRGNETVEEVAEDYLKELIDRSMVQLMSRRSSAGIKTCRIHDMLWNLSISVATEDSFLDVHKSTNFESPVRARRLTVYGDHDKYFSLNKNSPTRYLRSFLCHTTQLYYQSFSRQHWRFLYGGFRLLRVLDLPRIGIWELPGGIGEMIHLRYLGLRDNGLTSLPRTICNLINLQTLDIKPAFLLSRQHIPGVFSEMDQLRHLHMCRGKIEGPSRIGKLRNLQTLSTIEAGNWIEGGLSQLTNLQKLVVTKVLNSHREALSNSIIHLENLQSLCLSTRCLFIGRGRSGDISVGLDDSVILPTLTFSNHIHLYKLQLVGRLEKLPDLHGLPQNITHLKLEESCLMQDPMVTLEKLPHLQTLGLSGNAYMGKTMVCSAGGFPQLQELELRELYKLEEWRVEEGAMSSILHVRLIICRNLKMLPKGLQHMTTLKELRLLRMPEAFKARILPENVGEDWYKIQHVPSIVIKDDRNSRWETAY